MGSEPFQRKPTISSNSRDGRKLILSVDDDTRVLFARYRLLEDAGYAVVSASDGVQALQLFGSNPVDLVLLDYSMPGMYGDLVAQAMKEYNLGVPIILVSGAEVPDRALAEVNRHIRKAEGPELLLQTIQELLASDQRIRQNNREEASLTGDETLPGPNP
jgi:CheY-like chemotaxis protein